MADGRVGDIGTTFVATVVDQDGAVVDLSGASTKQLVFRKPDGTTVTKTAGFVTDGTDGKIDYTTLSGDLDIAGTWRWQARAVEGATQWTSSEATYNIHPALDD